MPIFAVERNEIFRLAELQQDFLFFLAGVAGNVNRGRTSAFIVDENAAAEEVIDHAENSLFISRNLAGRKYDCVVFGDGEEAMIIDRNAGHCRQRFGLRAASENNDAFGVESLDVLRTDDAAIGDAQLVETVRDFDVIDHAAADEADFAADDACEIDHLLNAMNRT